MAVKLIPKKKHEINSRCELGSLKEEQTQHKNSPITCEGIEVKQRKPLMEYFTLKKPKCYGKKWVSEPYVTVAATIYGRY